MKSARILYHPKPIRPATSRKPLLVRRSFINDSETFKEELKVDSESQKLYELATIEKEIRQRDSNVLRIQRLPGRSRRQFQHSKVLKRPKNPMTRDRAFAQQLNDVETDSSIDSNYNCPILHQ
eukprot:TRINITY_DN10123_c0_g1_i2.p1 TRINITY_DN10123_c0_g1~~TRINITY_DN10123_c0_g1_i2.p1  ORF type:complete len:123 (-),score=19.88 TRINITY_DN10123_c0_g1_i2:210-578(-)